MYNAPGDGNVKDFRLGNVGQIRLRAGSNGNERVKVGAVIGYQQKRGQILQLFKTVALNLNPSQVQNQPYRLIQQPAEKRVFLSDRLGFIYCQRDQIQQQKV